MNTRPAPAAPPLSSLHLTLLAAALLAGVPAAGQQDGPDRSLPTIVVIGKAADAVARQPASVSVVTAEELRLQQPRSTEEALRAVPGVAIKPEEESAIVANIGIRGLSSADYKTLILEDGAPVAPGLFVGNGRYYNPRVQRMESIEVLKGAASLRYGPSTIGGVINYVTRQPRDGVELGVRSGSFNTHEAALELGASTESGDARFGAFVTHATSDGFMDKGYDMTDVVLKAGLELAGNQRVAVKYTDYRNDANISYRGLFLGEYEAGAEYNPAPDDWFITGRRSFDVNHEWDLSDKARLNTLVYTSETFRHYWRYNTDNAASAAAGSWIYTDTLNGNNRDFERLGIDTRLTLDHFVLGVSNEAEIGVRYMKEEMVDMTVGATRATPRTGSINRDVVDSADSVALYAQNRFLMTDRLAFTAGLRAERYEQQRVDRRLPGTGIVNQADTSNTEIMPGVGVTYGFDEGPQLFANVYEAFSPALNGDALNGLTDQRLDAERSMNVEVGLRGGDRVRYEVAVFRMEFDNQIIPANSNSQFQVTNGGETLHRGIEAGLGVELGGGFSLDTNITYIPVAEFSGDRFDRNGALTTPDGNRIPYTPERVANLGVVYARENVTAGLYVNHTGSQYTDVLNTRALTESLTGFFTGRIDGYTIVNLNVAYDVSPRLNLAATLKNMTDERYIASLRQGIYVGPERSVDVGLRYRF